MKAHKNYFNQILEGWITPISWNNNGRVERFSLYTTNEEDIIIDERYLKQPLNKFKGKEVIVYGTLSIWDSDIKILYPNSIEEKNPSSKGSTESLNTFIEDHHVHLSASNL